MRIAVSGPDGFIAWHTRCVIRSRFGGDAILLGRNEFADPQLMDAALRDADAVIHLAGVNRGSDSQVGQTNPRLAQALAAGLTRTGKSIPVVYGNSIQSDCGNLFGESKRLAADCLREWGLTANAPVCDVVLPNIFGEYGRPFYNSVVATFCQLLADAEQPQVVDDKPLDLLHVQAAAHLLVDLAVRGASGQVRPAGTEVLVSDILTRLAAIAADYGTGDLPNLADPFTRDLFNTYRSYTFPQRSPIYPPVRGDERGELYESVRALGGESQVFFSTTRPGFTRGNHYHLHKVERFLVLSGSAVINLRRLFTAEVVSIAVSGDSPAIVDMPTMWVHSITNIGDDDLLTLFYADAVFDADHPDTYPEAV